MAKRSQFGLTLIELIVVITLLALLLGLSAVLFKNANKDLGVRAASGQMIAQLRHVREFTRAESAPGWVVLDLTYPHSFYMLTKETVGMWHFEDRNGTTSRGAFDRDATLNRVRTVPGRIGEAFELRASSTIDCGEVPVYTPDQGLAVDFWLYRRPSQSGMQTICTIGNEFEIRLNATGRPQVKIGDLKLNAPSNMTVPIESWVRMQFSYNGMEARLFMNNVAVATVSGKADWTRNSPLVIGGERRGFVGIVDEFSIGLIVPTERYILPNECTLEMTKGQISFGVNQGWIVVDKKGKPTQVWIHFDGEGRLDTRYHQQPIIFKVKSPTDEKEITIPLTGIVSRNP